MWLLRSIARLRVGIGDPEPAQYGRFQPFHHGRLIVGLVVVADKVQKSMNNQMGEMIGKVQPLAPGFFGNGFPGHDDIAERRAQPAGNEGSGRKRQDIGGFVVAAILPVQHPHTRIIGEDEGDLGVFSDDRKLGRPAGGKRAIDQGLQLGLRRPAVGLDQNIGENARTGRVRRQGQIPSPGVRSGLS